jgi:hypothetical protein
LVCAPFWISEAGLKLKTKHITLGVVCSALLVPGIYADSIGEPGRSAGGKNA